METLTLEANEEFIQCSVQFFVQIIKVIIVLTDSANKFTSFLSYGRRWNFAVELTWSKEIDNWKRLSDHRIHGFTFYFILFASRIGLTAYIGFISFSLSADITGWNCNREERREGEKEKRKKVH